MKVQYRLVVAGIVAAALVGCDPYPVPREPDHAELFVEFNSTGGADVMLMLGGDQKTSTELLDAGHAVAPVLFNEHGPETVSVQKQTVTSGFPFIRISAANVYAVGQHSVVHVDTAAALSLLGGMGYRNVYVDVSAPNRTDTATWNDPPDVTQPGDWTWNAAVPGQGAPVGDITVVPPPASHTQQNAGQAGWVALSLVCIGAAGFLVAAVATRRRRRRPVPGFNPPPGWPTPPLGWTPPPGWQPDPDWPAAPNDWRFFN